MRKTKSNTTAAPQMTAGELRAAKTEARIAEARDAFLAAGAESFTIRNRAVFTKRDDLSERIRAAVSAYRAA